MTAKSAVVRITRTNRLLKDLGHTEVLEALQEAVEMKRALKVIYTWTRVDEGDPKIIETIEKVLTKA